MKWGWIVLAGLVLACDLASASDVDSLDSLLQQVRNASQAQRQRDAEREERFLGLHHQRQRLLDEAKAEYTNEMQRKTELEQTFQQNQQQLEIQRALLKEKTGFLGELFGTVRQMASESHTIFADSLISILRPEDLVFLKELASSPELPSIDQLEGLWQILLERMVAAGRIQRFEAPVITSEGVEDQRQVTTVGTFNAVSNGHYLRHLPESRKLMELGRQPAPRFQIMAKQLETEQGLVRMAVDPSRGAILSLLVQSPTLWERIQQGGMIGYLIIVLGVLGLTIILIRLVLLMAVTNKINRQLKSDSIAENNPLGRLLAVADASRHLQAEALQLRLDEAILREIPGLRRGLKVVGVFAAVAPLLGLLGTVTGMIETFQSITLFGTGDPRLMSGGISQALVTTELGLVVAIPLVLLHSFVSGRSNRLVQIMDQQSAALVAERAET